MRRLRLSLLILLLSPVATRGAEPSSPQLAAFERAGQSFAARDFAGVVAALEPFAKGDPVPPLRTLLAAAYLELGRAADAAALLAPVAGSAAAGAPLLYQASRAAAALGNEAQADAYLARAAALDPKSLAARALGMRHGAAGKIDEACRLLQPYTAAHPDDTEARLAAAFCSLELDQRDTTAGLLAELPAGEPRARLLRARLAILRGQPDEAITQLEPLAAAPPAEVAHELRRNLAEAYLVVGKAQSAVPLLAGHAAGDSTLTLLLARAHQQAGDPAAAIAAVAPFAAQLTAATPPPEVPTSVLAGMALEWGRALLALQRWSEAVTALQAATRHDPKSAPAWQGLVQALRGVGRREEAEAAVTRLRELTVQP